MLNNWPSYFSTTYSKLISHKSIIFNLRKTRLLTTDPKSKVAILNHIAKEKVVEEELSKKEKECLKEATKAQIESEKSIKHLDQVKGKT